MSAYLPLEGVRVCDFACVWAGQTATMYLADLGADCIKVENPYVWNPATRAAAPVLPAPLAQILPPWMAGHPNNDPGPRPWNNSPAFIHVIRNKRSFTVDSRRPEGLAIVKSLIAISDVLAENLAIGTLEKLGLDDDAIRAARPDIVILHLPAYGRTGAYVEGRGYGAHIDGVAGSTILRGYRDSAPETNVQTFAGDFFVGMHGGLAALAALRHRRLTGQGQTIELAQAECSASMFPQAALDAAWNGRAAGSIGNRSTEGFAPNGVFAARGEEQWLALSCRSDDEWQALVDFLGRPAWAASPDLATAEGRRVAEDAIEEELAALIAGRDREELFRDLQSVGVTAGPVLSAKHVTEDPHAIQSPAFQRLDAREDYPATDFPAPSFTFSRSDITIRTAPAFLGEHNDYVYRELLGVSDEEYAKLEAEGHIATTYADEIMGR
ncbi:MAG: CoA transferase [Chloroflexi bacterium]|nr:CoA transferase [Chloroflexota bacterium]